MIAASLIFPLIASAMVATFGRREPRLATASIVFLFIIPLLSLLPGIPLLPAADTTASQTTAPSLLWPGIWLLGALPLLLRLALCSFHLQRWRRNSIFLRTLTLPCGRSVELRIKPGLRGPAAAGILQPVIYVPEAWHHWSAGTRRIVLAHELAHHTHRDPLWRAISSLVCAMHWYHPLVWWLARRHQLHAEFAADAHVLREGVPPKTYATLLCDLASPRNMPLAALPMAERSLLRGRVTRIFHPQAGLSTPAVALLLFGVSTSAVLLSLLRSKEGTTPDSAPVPPQEIHLRLSANPFPGE